MDIWSGVIGAVIGAVITGLITLNINRSRVYADVISTSRNNWVNLWRDEISKFLSICDM